MTRLYSPQGVQGVGTDEEALKVAWAVLNEHWQKCGGSYFSSRHLSGQNASGPGSLGSGGMVEGNIVVELKGLQAEASQDELSSADRLNGIKWSGEVMFSAEVYRTHIPFKEWGVVGWGAWKDAAEPLTVSLRNVAGRWNSRGSAQYGSEGIPCYGVYNAITIRAGAPGLIACADFPE